MKMLARRVEGEASNATVSEKAREWMAKRREMGTHNDSIFVTMFGFLLESYARPGEPFPANRLALYQHDEELVMRHCQVWVTPVQLEQSHLFIDEDGDIVADGTGGWDTSAVFGTAYPTESDW